LTVTSGGRLTLRKINKKIEKINGLALGVYFFPHPQPHFLSFFTSFSAIYKSPLLGLDMSRLIPFLSLRT
jgi:hypothetical protein